jgi:NitT/TauT family transport system substrate-binding protein
MTNDVTGFGAGFSRRNFLRATGILIPTAFGLASLSACGDDAEPQASSGGELETVSARYMTALGFSLSFVEAVVAKERGFLNDFGLEMELQGGQGTATALQGLLARSAEITRASPINTMIASANEDAPIRSIGTVRQKSQFELVSLASAPIKTPEELEGKVCGIVSAGGATENLLDLMLLKAGVEPTSVQRPITGVGGAAYELARDGQIDAWISVDRDRAQIEREDPDALFYFTTDEYATVPSDSYAVSQATIDSGTDMPARFLAGVMAAIRFAADEANWDQVIKDLQKYNNELDRDEALLEMPLLVESWMAAGEDKILSLDEETWKEGMAGLAKAGLAEQSVGLDKLIYTGYYEQALKL